jgi:hypothetical protein
VSGKNQSDEIRIVNPVKGELILQIFQPIQMLELALFDLGGRQIWHTRIEDVQVSHQFQLNSLPAGQYLLQAQWPNGEENRMIQKL